MLAMLSSIGWPVLIGLAVTSIFFALIYRGPLNLPIMHRYFASHPVTFFETGFFFVGLAALLLKWFSVMGEYGSAGKVELEEAPEHGQPISDCGAMLDAICELPASVRNSFLGRRLTDALELIERSNSAENLNDELKYLADVEAARQQDSYALVRIVIWATPMLGFLGTVMGITEALGDLSKNAELLATSIDKAINGLLGGLYVAFDTTALALTLSMVLMFIQFIIDRIETQLLGQVDQKANEFLVGRFEVVASSTDPQVATIERMAHAVIKSSEQLVQRQAQLWQNTIDAAHDHWNRLFTSAGDQFQGAFAAVVKQSLADHTQQLVKTEKLVVEQVGKEWQRVQTGMTEHAMLLLQQQNELVKQGEVMVKVLSATNDVIKLENALNNNLAALSTAGNFEDTVNSLSAAIHLLNTRLGKPLDGAAAVDLTRTKSQGKAA